MSKRWYGKFRGTVSTSADPLGLGRLRARVPDVTGEGDCGWAMPCVPFAGPDRGFFALPADGAGVWIEFEGGDPDHPIWTGCWWGSPAEVPTGVPGPPHPHAVMLRSGGGSGILLDEAPGGGLVLSTSTGQSITVSATGIRIDNGAGASITLEGPSVSVNGGALEVT